MGHADVDSRLKELYGLLKEPHTVAELALKTGRSKKGVYKDLGKLAFCGCRLESRLGVYWLDHSAYSIPTRRKYRSHR